MSDLQRDARKWLSQRFMPYCLVHASKITQAKLIINNLSPAEFLRPFGQVGNLGGYIVRTSDRNDGIKFQNFTVNFVDSSHMTGDPTIVNLILKQCKPKQDDHVSDLDRETAQD